MMLLACSECRAAAPAGSTFCAVCGGLLEFTLKRAPAPAPTLLRRFTLRRTSQHPLDRSGVWRFRDLLPPLAGEAVTLQENVVPVLAASAGAKYADATRVAYLHLGSNPTGSFKDAGMTVAISQAKAHGARLAVCASTGNTAASMAAYAARAGMNALVLVPSGGVSEAKLAQTLDYGAKVVTLAGDFDRALEFVRTLDPARFALLNSVNPYRIEGQKCAAFALLEARDWVAPEWLVLPGGNLGNTSAFGKGFREALALDLIGRIPRIAVVQAAGAAPFAHLWQNGGELRPVKAHTSATAINIGAPASWKKALAEVRESQGTVLAVSDEEIADARAIVGRDGVGCEPASAASLAGLRKLRELGIVGCDDDTVLVLTGNVLKDTDYATEYHTSGSPYANRVTHAESDAALHEFIDGLSEIRV